MLENVHKQQSPDGVRAQHGHPCKGLLHQVDVAAVDGSVHLKTGGERTGRYFVWNGKPGTGLGGTQIEKRKKVGVLTWVDQLIEID